MANIGIFAKMYRTAASRTACAKKHRRNCIVIGICVAADDSGEKWVCWRRRRRRPACISRLSRFCIACVYNRSRLIERGRYRGLSINDGADRVAGAGALSNEICVSMNRPCAAKMAAQHQAESRHISSSRIIRNTRAQKRYLEATAFWCVAK